MSLGILPGGSGTQRLPRVTEVTDALTMITSGRPVSAKQALSKGIVDKVGVIDCIGIKINLVLPIHSDVWGVVAERIRASDSSSGGVGMWVRILVVTLVSLSKTLNHYF